MLVYIYLHRKYTQAISHVQSFPFRPYTSFNILRLITPRLSPIIVALFCPHFTNDKYIYLPKVFTTHNKYLTFQFGNTKNASTSFVITQRKIPNIPVDQGWASAYMCRMDSRKATVAAVIANEIPYH